MREIQRDIVGIAIISADDKVLLVEGDPANKGSYEGFWVVPGGGVEAGESTEQAARRETFEETGINTSLYKAEFVADGRTGLTEKTLKQTGERVLVHMTFTEYIIRIDDKKAEDIKVTLSHEHHRFGWYSRNELDGIKLGPPTEAFMKVIGFL